MTVRFTASASAPYYTKEAKSLPNDVMYDSYYEGSEAAKTNSNVCLQPWQRFGIMGGKMIKETFVSIAKLAM